MKNSLDIGLQYGFLVKKLRDAGIGSHGVEAFRRPYSVYDDLVYDYDATVECTSNKIFI
jgi:hypothetical protein